MKKLLAFFFLIIGAFLSLGVVPGEESHAAYSLYDAMRDNDASPPKFMPSTGKYRAGDVTDITQLLQKATNVIVGISGVIAVFFVVYNGAWLVGSTGSTEEIEKAKKGFIWSAAGLVLIIFAYVIIKTIITFTYSGDGVKEPANKIPEEIDFDPNKIVPQGKKASTQDFDPEASAGDPGKEEVPVISEEKPAPKKSKKLGTQKQVAESCQDMEGDLGEGICKSGCTTDEVMVVDYDCAKDCCVKK